jgi:GntR family transcriptional regulator, transcriptional repressor for pyruvate dehydrogenase complex
VVLHPVARRSVPDEVFDQLVTDILDGELVPGSELPAERRLAEVLGVSRPAVREALQRLGQAGLIEVRQGDATTVRDYHRTAGPDLLPRLLLRHGAPDLGVARGILEVRFALIPDVARRCAARRSDAVASRLRDLVGRMEDQAGDLAALQHTAHELTSALVDGSDNVVYRLLFNALEAAYLPAMDVLTGVLVDEVTDVAGHDELVTAVEARDAAKAAAVARRVVGQGTTAAMAAIDELTLRG